jgi:hypothetical protein
MFSIARLYNSACSYSVIPIRIYPIMMSIVFHHYKILKNRLNSHIFFSKNEDNINQNSIILQQELDKWDNSFSSILSKQNRILFKQMLQSPYKYSNAIDAKGKNYSTESLLMSFMFEQYKIIK